MWLSLSLDLVIEKLDKMKRLEKLTVRRTPNENQEEVVMSDSEGRIETVEDRLAIIQSRVQTVLIQTDGLHQYRIPRLFIVLPKVMRSRDGLEKPSSYQFRLYFLCECGAHTMSEDSKDKHEIHLAKHEGYDIDRPNEFFQKYGSYVLTMKQMIKYGVTVAGIIMPPLPHFKLVGGVEAEEKTLGIVKQDISPLVDETITYIKDQSNKADVDSKPSTTVTGFDGLKVLEGAHVQQLEVFLKIKDRGRMLGNLYRIVTLEGQVKWVCIDHYRGNYRETTVKKLRDIVTVSGGGL
ncbi:hypothetical protein EDD21DRAFT_382679, partial [Dissophora ornata]